MVLAGMGVGHGGRPWKQACERLGLRQAVVSGVKRRLAARWAMCLPSSPRPRPFHSSTCSVVKGSKGLNGSHTAEELITDEELITAPVHQA